MNYILKWFFDHDMFDMGMFLIFAVTPCVLAVGAGVGACYHMKARADIQSECLKTRCSSGNRQFDDSKCWCSN